MPVPPGAALVMEKELRVLLVDDDEDEYILLRDMFDRLPGSDSTGRFHLDWAGSYEDALERCKSTHHHIHLIDYHLGRHTGLELLRAIEEQGCRVPSILLTGQGSYELDLAAMQQGVYDYLIKDQVNETLLERTIRYALERRETEEELERRVQERTQELAEANAVLKREILQRTRAEAVLRESEERFRALANTTSAAIFIVQDGKIGYANPAARFVTGYAPDEIIGTELWRLVHPAYQDGVRRERLVSSWAVDLPARYEIKIIHKSGSERWVDVTVGEMEFEGRPARVFTAFDITERDLAERALRKVRDELEDRVAERTAEIIAASQRMRAILTTLPVGMVIAGGDGEILESNQAFTDLWDADSSAGYLHDWPALPASLPEDGQPVVLAEWLAERTVKQGQSILSVPVDIQTLSKARKTILYSSVPIFDPEGAVMGGVAVLQDITHQRHLEQRARAAALSARQRADELAGLNDATAALLTTLDLDELLRRILDSAQRAIPAAEKGMLHLISPSTGFLQVRATLGLTDERISLIRAPHGLGLPAKVVQERSPLIVADLQDRSLESISNSIPRELLPARSIMFAPLRFGDDVLGTLSLSAEKPNAFNESNMRLLTSFAATTTAALQNAILHTEIKHLAVTDPLTGEYNRRAFFELGQRELDRYHRFNHPLSAVMMDLDNFKRLNDTYGHVAGDQILRDLAERCRTSIRDTDLFGRYGGDEFALLLPDTDLVGAEHIANRIREAVLQQLWTVEGQPVPVSISLGVSAARHSHRVLEEVLAEADQALYLAKTGGRNRIVVREPEGG